MASVESHLVAQGLDIRDLQLVQLGLERWQAGLGYAMEGIKQSE